MLISGVFFSMCYLFILHVTAISFLKTKIIWDDGNQIWTWTFESILVRSFEVCRGVGGGSAVSVLWLLFPAPLHCPSGPSKWPQRVDRAWGWGSLRGSGCLCLGCWGAAVQAGGWAHRGRLPSLMCVCWTHMLCVSLLTVGQNLWQMARDAAGNCGTCHEKFSPVPTSLSE